MMAGVSAWRSEEMTMWSQASDFISKMEEVDEATCWAMLIGRGVGRIGFAGDGRLHIRPVNFAVVNRSVVFRTTEQSLLGRQIDGAEVVFEVDHTEEVAESGWSVVVNGNMYKVPHPETDLLLRELPLHPWAPGVRDRWFRILPSSVSGRIIDRQRRQQPDSPMSYMTPG
jgi:nitroimidazol reductase NimA-like FMN-containing flavoprotein (pyridoxamine 5'-phosphate oxidase superfamily)